MISEEYGQRELDVWKLTEGMFDYNVLQSVTDFNDLAASMKEVFWFLHTALEKKKMDYNSDVVGAIIQYIEQNLSGDLGNETIARKFRLSSGYMGRLFKSHGYFISYLCFQTDDRRESVGLCLTNPNGESGYPAAKRQL